jgi:hypothetical protein
VSDLPEDLLYLVEVLKTAAKNCPSKGILPRQARMHRRIYQRRLTIICEFGDRGLRICGKKFLAYKYWHISISGLGLSPEPIPPKMEDVILIKRAFFGTDETVELLRTKGWCVHLWKQL